VFSGHPTRTTWGNTLRVLSYIKFIARNIEQKYCIFVSGDDAAIIIPRIYLQSFLINLHKSYSIESEGIHGLG